MQPNITFDEYREQFLKSEPGSDIWWDALDAMPHVANTKSDWSEYLRILFDELRYGLSHPEVTIAANGICFIAFQEQKMNDGRYGTFCSFLKRCFQAIKHSL